VAVAFEASLDAVPPAVEPAVDPIALPIEALGTQLTPVRFGDGRAAVEATVDAIAPSIEAMLDAVARVGVRGQRGGAEQEAAGEGQGGEPHGLHRILLFVRLGVGRELDDGFNARPRRRLRCARVDCALRRMRRQLAPEALMAAWLLGVACLLQARVALAHPGHGQAPAASWLHGLEPAHLAPALAGLAAALAARAALRRLAAARERRG
jgi:hypothetical protein